MDTLLFLMLMLQDKNKSNWDWLFYLMLIGGSLLSPARSVSPFSTDLFKGLSPFDNQKWNPQLFGMPLFNNSLSQSATPTPGSTQLSTSLLPVSAGVNTTPSPTMYNDIPLPITQTEAQKAMVYTGNIISGSGTPSDPYSAGMPGPVSADVGYGTGINWD